MNENIQEGNGAGNSSPSASADDNTNSVETTRLWRRFIVFWQELLAFLKGLVALGDDTDFEGTRQGIIRDIPFKGHTIYILICSIFIASIGLNLNSPAVIIGAMLVAPLMGPILGAGFALGTNDVQLLMKALKNFGVMVFISLLTSTLYFLVTPLVEYQPELLARTKPTTLDIFVAIFGGIAGIVAGSRKEKSNVIPGVAIATALMPPLCTSGFGLATGNMAYFFGAFYLFLLNSIFICASTVIGVRYLRFPLKQFMDRKRERKVKLYMAIGMTIIIIPSLWIFWGVLKESYFNSQARNFVKEQIHYSQSRIVNSNFVWSDTEPKIEIFMVGGQVPEDTILSWRNMLATYGLENVILDVYGNGSRLTNENEMAILQGQIRQDIVEDLFEKTQAELDAKESEIEDLKRKIAGSGLGNEEFVKMSKELKIQFDGLTKLSYASSLESDFQHPTDTIPTLLVSWKNGTNSKVMAEGEEKMEKLIKLRLSLDTLRVVRY